MNDAEQWLRILGTPFGLSAVFLFAVWRMAKWLRPKADAIFERHMAFIDAAQKCNQENTECIKEVRDSQKAIERSQKNLQQIAGEQSAVIRGMGEALARIADAK